MFVWVSSDGRRSGSGCGGCGLTLLIVPLFLLCGGFRDSSFLLLMILGGLLMLFVLPRLSSSPADAESDYDKRKNDAYPEKPKRDNETLIGADGEVMDVIDEQSPDYRETPRGGNVISG
jgi:hypothetical protein